MGDQVLSPTVLGSATPYPAPDNPCSGYLVSSGDSLRAPADRLLMLPMFCVHLGRAYSNRCDLLERLQGVLGKVERAARVARRGQRS